MITKVVNVNLHQPIYERLTAKQGDIASRYLLFHLLDGDKPFDLTGKSVRVYAIKPDKTEIFNDLTINDASKGYCTLELTSQCLASAGVVKMELYISESGKVLTSIPFELDVIACINTANGVASTNEFSALEVALGSLQDYYNLRSEIVQARKGYRTVGKRLDNFDSQLDNIKNATKQIYKSTIGVNMWFNIGSSDSYINEVLNDMERLKIKSLLLPCYNVITGNDVDGYSYTKNVSEEQITNVITKAREKGIEDIIIKLHRDGKKDTNSLKWIEMWQTVVNEYIQICKKNNITSLVFVNEQKNATANNIDKWIEIITSVKNNGLKAICSLADISEFNSSIINELVDVIGINHYPKLTNKNEVVTQEEYNKRMFSNSLPLFKRVKKLYPNTAIWITEIGCTRNIDALYSPASWEFDTTTQSNDIQALFVDSVMSTFGCYDNQLFEKVYWWSTDEKTKVNTFTFFGNDKAENNYLKYLGGV